MLHPSTCTPTRTGTPYSLPLTHCVSLVTLRNQAEPRQVLMAGLNQGESVAMRPSTVGTWRFGFECGHCATVRLVASAPRIVAADTGRAFDRRMLPSALRWRGGPWPLCSAQTSCSAADAM